MTADNIPQMGNFIENMAREFACVADRLVAERDAQAQRIAELLADVGRAKERIAELEEHATGLEATIEHLIETVPACKPVIRTYITEKLKINLN